jgi:hypothetical protein
LRWAAESHFPKLEFTASIARFLPIDPKEKLLNRDFKCASELENCAEQGFTLSALDETYLRSV